MEVCSINSDFMTLFEYQHIPAALSPFLASCCLSLGCDARITPSFKTTIYSKMPDKSARHN